MKPRTGAERYFKDQMRDPEFRTAYDAAVRRVQMVDELIRSIDAARTSAGISKAELARRAGMQPEAVRRLFSVAEANPTITTLVTLASALDLDVIVQQAHPAEPRRSGAAS